MQKMQVQSLGQEDPLEKEMATHCSIPAWKIPWTEETGGLQSTAFETGDAGYIAHALGIVARAKGMTQIARSTGLSREQLYRSFSEAGNPTLKTTLAVMKALGIDLTAKAHGERASV